MTIINPKNSRLIPDRFIYIDLESVKNGRLIKKQIINKSEAPSRAQRLINKNDILFSCVRPYQHNNYINLIENDAVASTGFAVLRGQVSSEFLFNLIDSKKFEIEVMNRCTGTSYPAISSTDLANINVFVPEDIEQAKIGVFLSKINKRIETQNKIIEDISIAINSIRNRMFCGSTSLRLGDIIEEVSERNKNNNLYDVYSVSNKLGFVKQSEQFDGREIASENKTSYKIICTNNFAYNPARINVGSIGFYNGENKIIISPMYLCFRIIDNKICPETLFSFFRSASFAHQLNNKLEGSVRQCLTIESLKSIKVPFANISQIKKYQNLISLLIIKLNNEKMILERQIKQKSYLLANMFI